MIERIVADLRLRPAEGHQRRQAAHDVEEVSRQRGQRPPLQTARGSRVARPTRMPKTGISGSVTQHDQRAHRVLGRDRHQGDARQHPGQHQRRHVAGQVGLGRGRAAGRQPGELAGRAAAPAVTQDGADDPTAYVGADDCGGAGAIVSVVHPVRRTGREHRDDDRGPGPHRPVVERGAGSAR